MDGKFIVLRLDEDDLVLRRGGFSNPGTCLYTLMSLSAEGGAQAEGTCLQCDLSLDASPGLNEQVEASATGDIKRAIRAAVTEVRIVVTPAASPGGGQQALAAAGGFSGLCRFVDLEKLQLPP